MEILADPPAWYVLGPAVGFVLVALLAAANLRMGVVGGWADLLERTTGRTAALPWKAWFVIGIAGGGLLFHLLAQSGSTGDGQGTAGHLFDSDVAVGAALVVAGTLIGYGARWAGGCTSGNGLSGASFGLKGSLVAMATFMGTAIAVTFALEALS